MLWLSKTIEKLIDFVLLEAKRRRGKFEICWGEITTIHLFILSVLRQRLGPCYTAFQFSNSLQIHSFATKWSGRVMEHKCIVLRAVSIILLDKRLNYKEVLFIKDCKVSATSLSQYLMGETRTKDFPPFVWLASKWLKIRDKISIVIK